MSRHLISQKLFQPPHYYKVSPFLLSRTCGDERLHVLAPLEEGEGEEAVRQREQHVAVADHVGHHGAGRVLHERFLDQGALLEDGHELE